MALVSNIVIGVFLYFVRFIDCIYFLKAHPISTEYQTQAGYNSQLSKIVFGTFREECIRDCVKMYKYDCSTGRLYYDSTNSFFNTPWGERINFDREVTEKDKVAVVRRIIENIPDYFTKSAQSSKTFNCAGCGDDLVLYFQATSGGIISRFYINSNLENLPNEVEPFARLLKEALVALE